VTPDIFPCPPAHRAEFARSGNPGNAGGTLWPKYDLANETLLEFPAGAPVQQKRFHAARLDWVERSLK